MSLDGTLPENQVWEEGRRHDEILEVPAHSNHSLGHDCYEAGYPLEESTPLLLDGPGRDFEAETILYEEGYPHLG